jgi:hypothetical protein
MVRYEDPKAKTGCDNVLTAQGYLTTHEAVIGQYLAMTKW